MLAGQTTNSFGLTNLVFSDAGLYSVEISGACNMVTNSASLIMNTNLAITSLSSLFVCPSNSATFSTVASGTGPISYVWRKDGTLIPLQTNSSLSFASVMASNAATYTVEVTGACGKATNSATLTVGSTVTATALTNQTVCSCQAATFATTASGNGPFSFVWRKAGVILPNQSSNILFLQNLTTNNSGLYSVEVGSSCTTVTNSAVLTVEPEITENPLILTNSGFITINDVAKATPYPSVVNVKCLFGKLRKLSLTLHQLSHTYPDDIDMLLVGPNGMAIKLMSDVGGGNSINAISLTFDQSAADLLPDDGQIFTGAYQPTDFEINDAFPAPAVTTNVVTSLSAYNGCNLNGNWSLYVLDDAGGDSGQIAQGWSLRMEYDVLRPVITDVKQLNNGAFQFVVTGEPTISRVIEASSNLTDWVPISTNTINGPSLIFVDVQTAFQYRFYRAVERRNPTVLQPGN